MHLVGVFMCDHGHNLLHSKLGLVHPRIVFAPPPHDHPQLAACRERAPDVSQRKSRQIEKHRAKPGEDVIVRTPKIIALRIGYKEPSVLDRCFGSFACCEVEEILRAVDAYGVTTATCAAMLRVVSPKPQPTSSTRPPAGKDLRLKNSSL